ncbi:hypothetical protein [Paenibacillus sp. LjRoot56]
MSNRGFDISNGRSSLYSPETRHQTALYATITPMVSVSFPIKPFRQD